MAQRSRKVVVVHNTATPYRSYLFGVMARWLSTRGYEFEVHFMRGRAQGRPSDWHVDRMTCPFRYRLWKTVGPVNIAESLHLNPGLILELILNPVDVLIVGGPWASMTGAAVSILARRRASVAWFEPNMSSPGARSSLGRSVKRLLLRRFQFRAVPGIEGVQWLQWLGGGRENGSRPLILPNLIDPDRFRGTCSAESVKWARAASRCAGTEHLAIMPARLIAAKGIIEFLRNVCCLDLTNWRIAIIGDGPLREEIQRCIGERKLERSVTVLEFQDYERMPAFYAAADLMILPSFYDPNPLSVVEALCCGLPLLLSKRVGNFPEALREGVNGWGFDPGVEFEVKNAAQQAFSASPDRLKSMGRASLQLFGMTWEPNQAVDKFMRDRKSVV